MMHFTKNLLDDNRIIKLLELILSEKSDGFRPPPILNSMCLVVALDALSTKSKTWNPTVLMDFVENDETLVHISNCIVNGDDGLISTAFNLIVAVGFTQKR